MSSRFPNAPVEASGSWSAPTMTSNPFSTPSSTANAAAAAASSSHTTSRSFRPRLPWPPISGIPIMSALFVARSTVLPRHLPSSTQPTDRSRSPRLWYRPPLSRPHRSARWINGSSASPLSAIASWLQLSASNLSQPVRFHDKSLRQPTFDAEGRACAITDVVERANLDLTEQSTPRTKCKTAEISPRQRDVLHGVGEAVTDFDLV